VNTRLVFVLVSIIFVMGLYAQTTPSSAAKKALPNVAVMPFSGDQNVTPEQLNFITSKFTGELIASNAFTVLDRGKMEFILKEQGFQQTGACNSSECKVQVGQLLGVDNLVAGNLVRFGKTYALHLDYVDVGTGQIVKSVDAEQKGDLEDVYKDLCHSGAENLEAALHNKPSATVPLVAAPVETVNLAKSVDTVQQRVMPVEAIPKMPSKAMSAKRKWALALWGTAALGAAGGYYFNGKGNTDQSNYNTAIAAKDQAESVTSYNDTKNADLYRNTSYGISIGALVIGAVLWLLPEGK